MTKSEKRMRLIGVTTGMLGWSLWSATTHPSIYQHLCSGLRLRCWGCCQSIRVICELVCLNTAGLCGLVLYHSPVEAIFFLVRDTALVSLYYSSYACVLAITEPSCRLLRSASCFVCVQGYFRHPSAHVPTWHQSSDETRSAVGHFFLNFKCTIL